MYDNETMFFNQFVRCPAKLNTQDYIIRESDTTIIEDNFHGDDSPV